MHITYIHTHTAGVSGINQSLNIQVDIQNQRGVHLHIGDITLCSC
jgi:hypothetical protein